MADERIEVEDLPSTSIPSVDHRVPAMLGGLTVYLTVAQIVEFAKDKLAGWFHAASGKAALADADEFGIVDTAASNVLKKVTLANLVTSIFKSARKIANAQFLSGSFGLFDTTDPTKKISIDHGLQPTATTRTLKAWNIGALALLQDQKPAGTSGGASAAGWNTRTLNTEVFDPDSIVSLASNVFTVTIDCECLAQCTGFLGNGMTVRLWNVTDSVEVVRGLSAFSGVSSAVGDSMAMMLMCLLVAGKSYRLESYHGTARSPDGLGVSSTEPTGVNVYASVYLKGKAA